MTNEEMQVYILKVTQGNRTDLVVTTYEIISKYIGDAENAFKNDDKEKFRWNLRKAGEFMNELISSLDLQYEVSLNLYRLYRYVQRTLSDASFSGETAKLKSAKQVLSGLREAFAEVAKQDKSGPVLRETGQIYAGITYGKGILNEMYEKKDGFQV